MENITGKHFSIIDLKGMSTVVYELYVTRRDYRFKYPRFTMERLTMSEIKKEGYSIKTFYIDDPDENGNQLMIFTFLDGNVSIINGLLINDEVKITKSPAINMKEILLPHDMKDIANRTNGTNEYIYIDIANRHHYGILLDCETAEEVKPFFEYDEKTGQVLNKIKLKTQTKYLQISIE